MFVDGDLTIHGVTKPVTIALETGGVLVSDKIGIDIEVAAVKVAVGADA